MTGQRTRVRDVMSREVITVPRWTSISEFLDVAERAGISGAPVVDADDRVVGMVSLSDVVRALQADKLGTGESDGSSFFGEAEAPLPSDRLGPRPGATAGAGGGDTVGDIMTGATVSVAGAREIRDAAAFLAQAGVHRALVMEDGRLAGIVTVHDLLEVLLEADD